MFLECWQEAENDEGYDVIICSGENEDVKELHAFSNILLSGRNIFITN